MPFTHKAISLTFDLGTGSFGQTGANRVKLSGGLRASANITVAGVQGLSSLELTVSGVTQSNMNALTTLGLDVRKVRKNVVTVEAGEVGGGMTTVYQGQIREAWADYSGMPNVVLRVHAQGPGREAVAPIPPTTYNGLTDVVTIMRGLAQQAGWGFTNDGVSFQLIDPYFAGTILDQIKACAQHANIMMQPGPPTLAIWPKGQARGGSVPIISPETGLIGYPTFTQSGIQLTTLFNPDVKFGQKIQVKTSAALPAELPNANGFWNVVSLSHTLESETPGGQWHSRIVAVPPGLFIAPRPV